MLNLSLFQNNIEKYFLGDNFDPMLIITIVRMKQLNDLNDNENDLYIQFVLQCRVNPKILKRNGMIVGSKTLLGYNYKKSIKCDSNFSNDKLQ